MLIQKGGITRSISDDRLHEYTTRGYTTVDVVESASCATCPAGTTPLQEEKRPEKPDAKE